MVEQYSIEDLHAKLFKIWKFINKEIKTHDTIPVLFSDCGFIVFRRQENQSIDLIRKCISCLENLQNKYLDEGLFLRGSVAYGDVIFKKNLLIGQPVVLAAKLEPNCPSPYIFFPLNEMKKLSTQSEIDYAVTKIQNMRFKNNDGMLRGLCIYPTNYTLYKTKIKQLSEKYLVTGPPEYGKFWFDTLMSLK